MRTRLTIADLGDLLKQPIVCVLATYRADGSVMLSPVWFEWREGGFNVWLGGANEGKARHIAADPRVRIVVHEQTLPYRGVEAWGSATLSPYGFHDVVRRTAARYYGEDAADAFADAYTEPGLVVRLVPDHIRAWDFSDEASSAEPG
ncbi:MAG: pyridoxamine 5'-phosphate oxidase family protein [Chloroflexota bacterium]